MKKNITQLVLLLLAVMICCISCNKDDDPDNTGMISLYESDKLLVSIVVGSTAKGFSFVFSNSIPDSLARVDFCRSYTHPLRYFEDQSGYFFIQDFFGWNVCQPTDTTLEGTDLWDLQDPVGNYFIRDMTDIATTVGSGFAEYYWNNPATGQNEKKLSYIEVISGIEYFIGSGFYIRSSSALITILESNKEILKNLNLSFAEGISAVFTDIYADSLDQVEFCRTLLDPIKFFEDNSGYFYIVDLKGNCISHGGNNTLEGQYLYDLQDVMGSYFIRDMIAVAENPGQGFTEYYWNNPATGKDEKKIAYVIRIPGTDYFIGSGVYI